MTDIALTYAPMPASLGLIDIALNGSDLQTGDELRTAVILSLFTNRRAAEDDVLPTGTTDPQGWWGDEFSDYDDDQIGSRLWLLQQAKQTDATLNQAKEYCQEALQWLLDDGIASDLSVDAAWIRQSMLGIQIQLTHPDGTNTRYDFLWDELSAQQDTGVQLIPDLQPFLVLETGAALVTNDGFLLAVA